MTEEEARERWCPFARVVTQAETGPVIFTGNRVLRMRKADSSPIGSGVPDGSYCLGSGCMAWRKLGDDAVELSDSRVGFVPAGYCGLAGRSE